MSCDLNSEFVSSEIDTLLATSADEGEFESKGEVSISLEKAREKLSQAGPIAPELASLKFAQAFFRLGVTRLDIRTAPKCWHFLPAKPVELDANEVRTHLARLALSKEKSPQADLAFGILGCLRWPITSVYWYGVRLWGSASETAPQEGLVLEFQGANPFPTTLWQERLGYSSMPVLVNDKLINGPYCSRAIFSHSTFSASPSLVEFHVPLEPAEPNRGSVPLNPVSKGSDILCYRPGSAVQRMKASQLDSTMHPGRLVAFPRKKGRLPFSESSRFHPLQAGVLLDPVSPPDFPRGFDVVFPADHLETDATRMKIVAGEAWNQELRQLASLLVEYPGAILGVLGSLAGKLTGVDAFKARQIEEQSKLLSDRGALSRTDLKERAKARSSSRLRWGLWMLTSFCICCLVRASKIVALAKPDLTTFLFENLFITLMIYAVLKWISNYRTLGLDVSRLEEDFDQLQELVQSPQEQLRAYASGHKAAGLP